MQFFYESVNNFLIQAPLELCSSLCVCMNDKNGAIVSQPLNSGRRIFPSVIVAILFPEKDLADVAMIDDRCQPHCQTYWFCFFG